MRLCQKCGAEVDPGANYCENCGIDMDEYPPVETGGEEGWPPAGEVQQRNPRVALIALLVAFFVLIAGVVLYIAMQA